MLHGYSPLFRPTMKRFLAVLASLLLLAFATNAQGGGGGLGGDRAARRLEKIESARVAFLTNRLNLTTEQAQKFWPIYNEYDARRRDLRKRAVGKAKEMATMSDAQLQSAVTDMMAARQDELNLDKEYLTKFQKVISLRQVVMLYRSERDFTKFLLRKLEERRGGGRGAGGGGGMPIDDAEDGD